MMCLAICYRAWGAIIGTVENVIISTTASTQRESQSDLYTRKRLSGFLRITRYNRERYNRERNFDIIIIF